MAKRRAKRMSKAEEEKRMQMLSEILDKWVYMYNSYDDEYYFLKHRLGKRKKVTRIEQILISGHSEQDGVYEISDYEIGFVYDSIQKKKKVVIKPQKYDMTLGLDCEGENKDIENYDELLKVMVAEGYVTEKELYAIFKGNNFHLNCDEVILSLVRNFRNRDVN